jgi:hypothetical protein
VSAAAGERAWLTGLLDRPLTPPDPAMLDAIAGGPIATRHALPRTQLDRLLDPAPLPAETGWCWLDDGVGYVAVRTPMPGVTGEMVDWWFDWHARDPLRYRVWHPGAHRGNRLEPPPAAPAGAPRAKAHWGAVHHPLEDVGTGMVHARIAFHPPRELGFSTDVLHDPRVATIVCGWAGDDRRRVRHSPMAHVFLRDPDADGVVLRSRFWLGAAVRPYAPVPTPLAALGERLLNTRRARRLTLPRDLPRALATHCAEEYANLGALLPQLHARCGGGER